MARPKRDYEVVRRDIPAALWPEIAGRIEEWKFKEKMKKWALESGDYSLSVSDCDENEKDRIKNRWKQQQKSEGK